MEKISKFDKRRAFNKAVGPGKNSKINKRRAYVYSGLQSMFLLGPYDIVIHEAGEIFSLLDMYQLKNMKKQVFIHIPKSRPCDISLVDFCTSENLNIYFLCFIAIMVHVEHKNLISILVTDCIQKRRGQALLFFSLLNTICYQILTTTWIGHQTPNQIQ